MSYLAVVGFDGLRGDASREWFRCSDLIEAARQAGRPMTRYEVWKAIAHLPPPSVMRYGHWHYTREHHDAVVAAARAEAEAAT